MLELQIEREKETIELNGRFWRTQYNGTIAQAAGDS